MGTAEPPPHQWRLVGPADVSIRCREMGTAERPEAGRVHRCLLRFYSLSRDGDSGTRRYRLSQPSGRCRFYSLSRDGDSGTPGSTGSDPREPGCFYSLSRDGDSGTHRQVEQGRAVRGFYSLSRDGDSGTSRSNLESGERRFYSLSRDGDSGTTPPRSGRPPSPSRFYSLSRDGDSGTPGQPARARGILKFVSIRCREMGTAEPYPRWRASDQHKRCPFAHPTEI